MKFRSFSIALVIILAPFIIGLTLFIVKGSEATHGKTHFITDTRENNKGMTYKGIKVDWTFCPDWEYKPLFLPSDEYLVFMFHYTNNEDYNASVMPSCSFASLGHRRYSANEEISMYIEDGVENEFKAEDETPITFEISSNATKHYIVTFEKSRSLDNFYVDVDVFRDAALRIHYKKEDGKWVNHENELIEKYQGRG